MDILAILNRIDTTLKERGYSKAELYSACSVSASAVSQWKSGRTDPSTKSLHRIADFLNVSYEYLVTGSEQQKAPTLTTKDERDIEKKLADVLADLESGQGGLAFSGEPMDDETRELLINSLRNSMEMGKALAKKKYTPKKYRKE